MQPTRESDAFQRHPCGCPVETWKFPYKCPAHAALDGRATLPWRGATNGSWYDDNCCPFCGRANAYGLACDRSELCELCSVRSCHSHGQATYQLSVICPKNINPRTKVGKAFLKSLNWRVQ